LNVFLFTIISFLLGSIPFSLIIGRWAAGVDIRQFGDHNPGATNVYRAAGIEWYIPALLLDALKGALPVGVAWYLVGVEGWQIIPIALAPIFGHAFSPWLGFRGGKAVATTFGIWTGLTLAAGPIILGVLLVLMYALMTIDAWAMLFAFLLFGVFIFNFYFPAYPSFLVIWGLNLVLLIWLHRADLAQKPAFRPKLWFWRTRGEK
jgi:glycerol-3-phosphate acyltransferase PlsY